MKQLTSRQLRSLWLEFFKSKGHTIIPSASLIPENDPTVLFTTAGMHPLVPYLLGEKHPAGTRLTDVQKCVRTGDIDEVGDASHCTFFEMLGNWSLGDYFKKEAISWSFEFLTDEKWLGIPKDKLYFTCFAGDENAPRDMESYQHWRDMGVEESHIFFLGKEHNWWGPAGVTGPCGPDTEMFIDTGKPACSDHCDPSCSCGKYLEIWNDVFMEYNKNEKGEFEPLAHKNVDTGMGLDRTICILQGKKSVYDTDVFADILAKISELSGKNYEDDEETTKAFRIVADHVRCATFIIGDEKGVTPSNVDQGYVLRRLLRRAIRFAMKLGIEQGGLPQVAQQVITQYGDIYPELEANREKILSEIAQEEERFSRTINQGMKEFDKLVTYLKTKEIPGKSAFRLYDTFGFP
ncbi:MAG: alanine--tRNA ligase, partial [Eubacteriales bacterium]|nr:alanine--tRNA ligase [Eubacteriales bacterium]